MDERPVFEFKMLDIKESAVEELKKFSKSIFDLDYILNTNSELKYTREIKNGFYWTKCENQQTSLYGSLYPQYTVGV
jgi:hypothetical protein